MAKAAAAARKGDADASDSFVMAPTIPALPPEATPAEPPKVARFPSGKKTTPFAKVEPPVAPLGAAPALPLPGQRSHAAPADGESRRHERAALAGTGSLVPVSVSGEVERIPPTERQRAPTAPPKRLESPRGAKPQRPSLLVWLFVGVVALAIAAYIVLRGRAEPPPPLWPSPTPAEPGPSGALGGERPEPTRTASTSARDGVDEVGATTAQTGTTGALDNAEVAEAAGLVVRGRYDEALLHYQALAERSPTEPVFRAMLRALKRAERERR